MGNKADARIAKTNEKLRNALLELMKKQSIDTISVTELCKTAGINRNTFYSHYREPVDLLNEIENELLGMMWNTLSQADKLAADLNTYIRSALQTINQNRELCYIILSRHGNRHFVKSLIEMLQPLVVHSWVAMGMTEEESAITYTYCVGGAIAVLEQWVNENYQTDVNRLSDMLSDLIENGRIRNINRY